MGELSLAKKSASGGGDLHSASVVWTLLQSASAYEVCNIPETGYVLCVDVTSQARMLIKDCVIIENIIGALNAQFYLTENQLTFEGSSDTANVAVVQLT